MGHLECGDVDLSYAVAMLQAIGIYFDKATVDEIMATFGKVPVRGGAYGRWREAAAMRMLDVGNLQDEKKAVQRRKSNRTRAIYKELVHSNRRMNQVGVADCGAVVS